MHSCAGTNLINIFPRGATTGELEDSLKREATHNSNYFSRSRPNHEAQELPSQRRVLIKYLFISVQRICHSRNWASWKRVSDGTKSNFMCLMSSFISFPSKGRNLRHFFALPTGNPLRIIDEGIWSAWRCAHAINLELIFSFFGRSPAFCLLFIEHTRRRAMHQWLYCTVM